MMILINFLRGSKLKPSYVGMERCSWVDIMVQAIYVLMCFSLTVVALKHNKKEQLLKAKLGKGLIDSDIKFSGGTLVKLMLAALVGGWVSGALGLGGGSIFNPILLSMGVSPKVSSSTGMYMILYSTAASTTVYIIYGLLDIKFACWIGFWCTAGAMVGLGLMNIVMKKFGR
jgi:uncharacterized membrane protein YfcA